MPASTGCILRYSPLSGNVYAITRWSERSDGTILAHTKHDVTADMNQLVQTIQFRGGRFVERATAPKKPPGLRR
jgi:hypothetical protein